MGEKTKKLDDEKGMEPYFFRASAADFNKIPGSPIAYWVSEAVLDAFEIGRPLAEYSKGSTGLQTSDGERFIRLVHEVSKNKIGLKWVRFAKGGSYRRWYGNVEHLVNWENNGTEIKQYVAGKYLYLKGNYGLVVKNESTYFDDGLLTSRVTSGSLSFRLKEKNEIYADACTAIFPKQTMFFLSLFNSKLLRIVRDLNPTMNFQAGDIEKFPVLQLIDDWVSQIPQNAVALSKSDWDAYETSWDFTTLPLLQPAHRQSTLSATYATLRVHWQGMTDEMRTLEQENNHIFIDAYGLSDELTPEVPIKEITLTCNPAYSIKGDLTDKAREEKLRDRTLREFLSYAVGCMFGRYSLDAPGLILANQGETLEDYLARVPEPTFTPDEDNIIPILEGDWFPDDITERFRRFLQVTFGEENLQDNLATIENALGKDIRRYFIRDFYTDHVKRYKKRPIYWLFSSPKGSFNALIYMHRYRSGTVSIVLNDYLREFRTKLTARKQSFEQVGISASASQKEKTQAIKTLEKINKVLDEINEYEHHILYPLATQKIEIDLDDGVKHNYPLFGKALKKVVGLS